MKEGVLAGLHTLRSQLQIVVNFFKHVFTLYYTRKKIKNHTKISQLKKKYFCQSENCSRGRNSDLCCQPLAIVNNILDKKEISIQVIENE